MFNPRERSLSQADSHNGYNEPNFNIDLKQCILDFISHYNQNHKDQIKYANGIENHCQTVKNPTALDLHFPSYEAVSDFLEMTHGLQQLNTDLKPIMRPAAGGIPGDTEKPSESYSLSGLIDGEIIIRLVGEQIPGKQNVFEELTYLPDEKPEHIADAKFVYRVGSNKRMWHLDEDLYEAKGTYVVDGVTHQNPAASLSESSLIDVITPGGWGTGPHGTSTKISNLNSMLHAMTRVRHDGVIERIKRDGTTYRYNKVEKKFELMAEKHPYPNILFGTHLGMLGIILNVELECEPAYDLECHMKKFNVAELIDEMQTKKLFRRADYTHFMLPPTYDENELDPNYKIKNVIVFESNKIPKGSKTLTGTIKPGGNVQKALNKISDLFNLGTLLDTFPSLIPFFNKYFVTSLEVSDQGDVMIAPSYQVMHYLKNYPRKIRDISLFVPDDDLCQRFVTAIKKIYKLFKDKIFHKEKPVSKVIFARRICTNHDGGLSASSVPEDSKMENIAAIDCVTDKQIKTFDPFLQMFWNELSELDARPHWGKEWPDFDVEKVYGDGYIEFIRALLFEQCKNRAEFDSFIIDPNNTLEWKKVLEKVSTSPFINHELDRILKLKKFTLEERNTAKLVQEHASYKQSFQESDAMKLKKIKVALVQHDDKIHSDEHGANLMAQIDKEHAKVATSVANTSHFRASVVEEKKAKEHLEADRLLQIEQAKEDQPAKTGCCAWLKRKC